MELELLTCKEVAELMRVSRSTVWKLAASGKLPGKKVGRGWRFPRDAIEQFFSFNAHKTERAEDDTDNASKRGQNLTG